MLTENKPKRSPSFFDGTFRASDCIEKSVLVPPNCPEQKFHIGQRVKARRDGKFFGVVVGFAYEAPNPTFKGGWTYDIQVQGSDKERLPVERSINESDLVLIPELPNNQIQSTGQEQNISNPDTKLLVEASESEYATWIIQMSNQRILFANPVALAANSRDAGRMIGQSILPLWENQSLTEMTRYLERDKQLNNYGTFGYRWAKKEDAPIWVWERVSHTFITDYRLVDFLGQACRFEIVKEAIPS